MIVKNGTDAKIEQIKKKLNLSGDVYIFNGHFIESLESHKKMFPTSSATNIQDAFSERVSLEFERQRILQEQMMQLNEEITNEEI